MKADTVEKMAWSFHRHWGSFYNLHRIWFNDEVIETKEVSRVFTQIVNAASKKPVLLIHNG